MDKFENAYLLLNSYLEHRGMPVITIDHFIELGFKVQDLKVVGQFDGLKVEIEPEKYEIMFGQTAVKFVPMQKDPLSHGKAQKEKEQVA